MLIVAEGRFNPDLVRKIATFRRETYARDGVQVSSADDAGSWHCAILRDGAIDGCVRYKRVGNGFVRIGGWAVRETRRGTRDAVRLALRCVELAQELGDVRGIATATTRHRSAMVLERLGGKVIHRYFDQHYQCEMAAIEFWLSGMRRRAA